MSFLSILPNYMLFVGAAKTEADSNDITESTHDIKPRIGMLGFLIFINVGIPVFLCNCCLLIDLFV